LLGDRPLFFFWFNISNIEYFINQIACQTIFSPNTVECC
jgi:hypothetical protein